MIFSQYRFDSDDKIEEMAGKLYRGANSIVKNSGIVMINLIVGAILLLDQPFASWDIFIYSILLPVPTWMYLSLKNGEQQKLNELLMDQLDPEEIYLISTTIEEILQIKDKYTDNYENKINELKDQLDILLEMKFPAILNYFKEGNIKLKVDSLAFYIYNNWKRHQSNIMQTI